MDLPGRNHVQHILDLALEHLSGYGVEREFSLIARAHPLKRVLMEPRRKVLVVDVDEHHNGADRRRDDVHSRAEHHLRDVACAGRPDHGAVEIVLRVGQLRRQPHDSCFLPVDFRVIGEARTFGGSFALGDRLSCAFQISSGDIEHRFETTRFS